MKITIAGAGEVGTYLAKMLCNENHDIIVIDDLHTENLTFLDSNYDLLTINDYPASLKVLKETRIHKTDLFIAVTPYETTNITAAILAKRLGAARTAVRIDNMEYMEVPNKTFFKDLGVDSLIYPELLAAKEISRLLRQSATNQAFDFSGGRLSLFVIKLEANAPVIGRSLTEIAQEDERFDFRVVAITRQDKTIIPHGRDRFIVNDIVYVMSNQTAMKDVLKYSGREYFHITNVMVLGGSKIGKKTAKELEGEFKIKLLEPDKERSFELADFLDKTLVLNADGTHIDVLLEEGIQDMDAFIAVTGNSETNILACLLAKQLGVKKTIAEIENMDFIKLAENLGVETVINKKLIAASHIHRFTTRAEVTEAQCLPGTDAEVLEFVVHDNAPITADIISNIEFPQGAIIGGIVRGRKSIVPKGKCQIKANDKVVVFTLPSAIDKVVRFFN